MPHHSEKLFQKKFVDTCKLMGADVYVQTPQYETGLPDLCVLYNGAHFVELKFKAGKLSEKQKIWRKRYIQHGCNYHLISYHPGSNTISRHTDENTQVGEGLGISFAGTAWFHDLFGNE